MLKSLKNIAIFLCHIPMIIMLVSWLKKFDIVSMIIAVAVMAVAVFLCRTCQKADNRKAVLLQVAFLIISAALMCISGWLLAVEPAWDFGRIYHGALDITTNGALTYTMPYYLESYNNFFITICLAPWFKITSIFGLHPLYSGILLNIIAMTLAQLFAVWAINVGISYQHGLFVRISMALFLPFYTYAPIFYTDTLSMPFVSFALLVYVLVKNKKVDGRVSVVLYALMGMSCFVGYKLKPTAAVICIAIMILSFLDGYKENIRNIAAALAVVVVCFGGYSIFENNTSLIDLTDIDDYRLPPEHYVMMGLKYNGGYNEEDHFYSLSFDNIEDRKAANIRQIKQRLRDYGPVGYGNFLLEKIHYTWLDGTYFAPRKLNIDPLRDTLASQIFTEQGDYYEIYEIAANGTQLALIVFMLLAVSDKKDLSLLSAMSVFALFVFLLVWETRSRYIVNYIPLFIVLASAGTQKWERKINERQEKVKADISNTDFHLGSRNSTERKTAATVGK